MSNYQRQKIDGVASPEEEVFTIQEEKDHESWTQFHRQQKLQRQHEHSQLGKRGVDQEVVVARLSILVFEEDVFFANMDATAFCEHSSATQINRHFVLENGLKRRQLNCTRQRVMSWPSGSRKMEFPKSEKVKRCLRQYSCPCVGF